MGLSPWRWIQSGCQRPTSVPRPCPARGPPESPHPGSTEDQDPEQHQSFDPNAQPAPPFQFDQRISWQAPRATVSSQALRTDCLHTRSNASCRGRVFFRQNRPARTSHPAQFHHHYIPRIRDSPRTNPRRTHHGDCNSNASRHVIAAIRPALSRCRSATPRLPVSNDDRFAHLEWHRPVLSNPHRPRIQHRLDCP